MDFLNFCTLFICIYCRYLYISLNLRHRLKTFNIKHSFSNFKFWSNLKCLHLRLLLIMSGDVETNPGPVRDHRQKDARVLYANIRGLRKNVRDLALCSQNFDIVFCSETLATERRHPVEFRIPGFNNPILKPVCPNSSDNMPSRRGMALYIRDGYCAFRRSQYECSCHEVICVRVSGQFNNFYIFGVYRSPSTNDSIYDCLLEKMAVIQGCDVKASFVFVGDFNAHHREWLGSASPTDAHGLAALDFSNLSNTSQLIDEPTRGDNCLDLVFTDVSALTDATVGTPIGCSDHSHIALKLKVVQNIPDVTVSQKVYLKSRANWDGIDGDLQNVCWSLIYRDPSPASKLNEVLVSIMERRIPSKILRHRLSDKPWFDDDCRRAYQAKQEAYRRWTRGGRDPLLWDNYLSLRNEASVTYSAAEADFHRHARRVLSDCTEPNKWWKTLKSSLFGSNSSMPPLMTSTGAVTNSPRDRVSLLSDVFKSKQCDDALELPPTCFPEVSLSRFAFKSKDVLRLLAELDSYGGLDPNGLLPVFLKRNRTILAPKLSVIFRILLRTGEFPATWRMANVTPIPKTSPPSIFPENYRPISITPCISKLYERLICARLTKYVEASSLLPNGQFAYRKGLGSCDALLSMVGSIQSNLDQGLESFAVSLDFSAAFDRVRHAALIYRLQLIGVGGPFLEIIENFLSSRSQSVCVEGFRGAADRVVSGVPQGSVLGPLLFIIFTSSMWDVVSNNLIAYADDATLLASVDRQTNGADVVASLNSDLEKILRWCETWGMKLNPKKTQSIVFSRSRTRGILPSLRIGDEVLLERDSIEILGIILDNKLTFEKHIRSMCSALSRKVGILRKSHKVFQSQAILRNCFYSFLLPCFEHCSPVWGFAARSHLDLLDRTLNHIKTLIPDLEINLQHRRNVASMCMFFKIVANPCHPAHAFLPPPSIPARFTRACLAMNSKAFVEHRCRTSQYQHSFINQCVRLWNNLPDLVVSQTDLQGFKVGANKHLPAPSRNGPIRF